MFVERTLQDLGVMFDESGRLRDKISGEYVSVSTIQGDPMVLVNAVTEFVFALFVSLSLGAAENGEGTRV